jgi:hypothetical protein
MNGQQQMPQDEIPVNEEHRPSVQNSQLVLDELLGYVSTPQSSQIEERVLLENSHKRKICA